MAHGSAIKLKPQRHRPTAFSPGSKCSVTHSSRSERRNRRHLRDNLMQGTRPSATMWYRVPGKRRSSHAASRTSRSAAPSVGRGSIFSFFMVLAPCISVLDVRRQGIPERRGGFSNQNVSPAMAPASVASIRARETASANGLPFPPSAAAHASASPRPIANH